MGRLWADRRHNMYSYVQDKDLKKYMISEGSDIVNRLKGKINSAGYLKVDFELVGSGLKNLITRNGNEPPDVDFNLLIFDMQEDYKESEIKEYIRKLLNKVLFEKRLGDCSDSTSALTVKSVPTIYGDYFSIDIAIIYIDDDGYRYRLKHEKHGSTYTDRWYWNEGINYDEIIDKTAAIKNAGGWDDFRVRYLKRKNRYLEKQDYNHPSFVVYIEVINEVYKMYHDRGWL